MKKKKNAQDTVKDVLTKYYRATYTNGDTEVFIEDNQRSAADYAANENSDGRTLAALKEYNDFPQALTDY